MVRVKYNKKKGILTFNKSISEKAGIDRVYSDGILCKGNWYSVIYRVNFMENIERLFEILRFYDIRFKFIFDCEKRELYLKIASQYTDITQAEEDLNILKADMINNLPDNIKISQMNLSQRMNLINKMSVIGEYFYTETYERDGDWVTDILMNNIIEKDEYLFAGKNERKKYLRTSFVNDFEDITELLKQKNVTYIIFDFANVSDDEVRIFMNSLYLGLDDNKLYLKMKAPVLYEAMYGNDMENVCLNEDKKLFTLFGLYFVNETDNEDFMEEDLLNNGRQMFCNGFHKKMYSSCVPNGIENYHQMRMCESDKVNKIVNKIIDTLCHNGTM